jgi:hypothetical protein
MVTSIDRVKPPRYNRSTFWAMFHHQIKTMTVHNKWAPPEIATHLLSVLQKQAANILHGVAIEATYKEIIEALESYYRDHHLAAAYHSQLKAWTQLSKSLQEFATATEQLTHHALVGLRKDHFRKKTAHASNSGIQEPEMKQDLVTGGE